MLTTLFTVQELQDSLQLPSRIARFYSVHGAAAAWSTCMAASVRCWQGECCCEGSGWTGLVLEQAICVCTPSSPYKGNGNSDCTPAIPTIERAALLPLHCPLPLEAYSSRYFQRSYAFYWVGRLTARLHYACKLGVFAATPSASFMSRAALRCGVQAAPRTHGPKVGCS
jgi:hypothetical protein